MKKREYIKIGYEEFTLKNKVLNYNDIINYDYKELSQCYKKCSSTKYSVLSHYYNLLNNNCIDVIRYGIKSYNQNIITIHAIINIDYIKYYVYITPTKNEIHKVCE